MPAAISWDIVPLRYQFIAAASRNSPANLDGSSRITAKSGEIGDGREFPAIA